jgi:DNA-binding NarL/FixJ family response regulator
MRVVIGEDETLLREGLALVIEQGGFHVVASAADAGSLVSEVSRHGPDLVITDIRMPPDHTDEGLRAALHIRRTMPRIAIVVLSQYVHRRYALELLAERPPGPHPPAGVGYLLKQRIADIAAFREALHQVCDGETVLDLHVVAPMMACARNEGTTLGSLTERQLEVLGLMAQGRSNTSIARALSITERAVIQHVSHIYDQLGLPVSEDDHRRVLAVIRYLSGERPIR